MEAKQLFAEATAEANASSNKPAKTWDMGKRWDTMNSIEKLQDKLSDMGVHSVLIMVAENPKSNQQEKYIQQEGWMNSCITVRLGKNSMWNCLSLIPNVSLIYEILNYFY